MRKILKQFTQRDAHPVIQFIKYGISGGVATAVDVLLFYFLAWKVLPALQESDPLVQLARSTLGVEFALTAVNETLRASRFILISGITFIFSNLTAYVLNIYWVFEPGRHNRHVEIILFYAVSITAIVIGTALGWGMINFLGMSTTASYLGKLFSAVMINYACRKFLIFKG